MKISYMLKREDFYAINRKTLGSYYSDCDTEKKLYIYPELNAIVTARPGRAVRRYLYTEYRVSGSPVKRLLVKLYAFFMLHSGGLFAAKSVRLKTRADGDTLIYPCNKKYRIFDFKSGTVTVIPKSDFPTGDIKNEIAFRKDTVADFVPALLSYTGDSYTERIIDGYPVARAGEREWELAERAYEIWSGYALPFCESICAAEYAAELSQNIDAQLCELTKMGKNVPRERTLMLVGALSDELSKGGGTVTVGLSHGDLQSGNIWVENGTDKIYIIDWESYGKRSVEYDKATLYEGIRRTARLSEYVRVKDAAHAVVLLEDIIFRLRELKNLPESFGEEDFMSYIKILEERYV